MVRVTRTTNRLPFNELSHQRFEDLCNILVYKLRNWDGLSHFGRSGADGGIDILGTYVDGGVKKQVYVQCKRYEKISKPHLKEIVDKIVLQSRLPEKLLVILSCSLSKVGDEFLRQYSTINKIKEVEVWDRSYLEAKLYSDHPELVYTFFGVELPSQKAEQKLAEKRIKDSERMGKKVQRELLDHAFLKRTGNMTKLAYDPALKFISEKVYIRSVEDRTYPNAEKLFPNGISPWFCTFFYNTYHDGLEFHLSPGIGIKAIFDKNGNWERLTDYNDPRQNDPAYRVTRIKMIGRIPYYTMVSVKREGDEYTSEPHIFCRFCFEGEPYEEIYYRFDVDTLKGEIDGRLEKYKQVEFPK